MSWIPENVPMSMVITVMCFMVFLNIGPSLTEDKAREKRIAILGTTEIPAASVDLSQFNFTDLVNGMLNKALRGTRKLFSFLSVTSYSSMAFHKVSILIYNISNLKHVDYHKFPMRYCYCLNNRTNDLADYTVLLLDIIGNSSSSLKELFKSTSIVSVSQSNESDCIYFCVMTGRTGRNLSDLWDLVQKSPVVNLTFPRNDSSGLDLESVLPNLITSAENTEFIMNVPTELWTLRTSTSAPVKGNPDGDQAITKHLTENYVPGHTTSSTINPLGISVVSTKKQDISIFTTQEIPSKGQSILLTKLPPLMHSVASKENTIVLTKSPLVVETVAQKGQQQPSDKISLFPHKDLKENSVSFLKHKTQDGSSVKLPGWTTIPALDMLQRPYTIMPLWTGNGPQNYNSSVTKRMTSGHFQHTQRGSSTRTSSTPLSPRSTDTGHTMVATLVKPVSPSHHGTSVDVTPLQADSDHLNKDKDITTKRLSWSQLTNGKKHNVHSATLSSLEALLPQVKPTIDVPKMSLYAYTQSRCRQAKLMVAAPSVTSVFPKVNSCVMELCRFFQQCLCVSQEQYSRHKKQRQCIQYYSWYLKNATYICDKVQRNPHRRTLKQKCLANICKSI